ncbi:hypothetical protein F443_03309 [Phytophthora nicotianae P1569]|uniref:Uncharacterized protein n=1 Tax=Phytophthora nicotianae P1569 TaxID=1317065 RepID=V9FRT2_PHYNI|nr:hypothetical protein F443_03309 [Phytophthora nicotianae P1569]
MKEASFSIVIIVDVCNFVKKYVTANPCFYFEELREEQRANFSDLLNISDSSICRALRFDLGLTRKVLTKRASESIPRERREYVQRLLPYYCGPDQRVSLTKRRRTLDLCFANTDGHRKSACTFLRRRAVCHTVSNCMSNSLYPLEVQKNRAEGRGS